MQDLKLTTFNLENLFSRYLSLSGPGQAGARVQLAGITSITYNGAPVAETTTLIQRNNTARAILDAHPDIAAFQEVENLWTLRCFNDEYLGGYFGPMVLILGNDGRGINVALCVRDGLAPNVRVEGIRTHVDEVNPNDKERKRVERFYNESTNEIEVLGALFSRDCLEVDVDAWGTPLTFLVNHFKSQDQKDASNKLRNEQARRVAQLVIEAQARNRRVVVMGDLNESMERGPLGKPQDAPKPTTLMPLKELIGKALTDPFEGMAENWTHFYAVDGDKSRLDYLLVDKQLPTSKPEILRDGLSLRCGDVKQHYPTIGYSGTEASDHCPVSATITVGR